MICIYKNLVKNIELGNNKNGIIQKKILQSFNLNIYNINYVVLVKKNNEEEICGIDNSFYSDIDLEVIKEIKIIDKLEENEKNIDIVKLREIYNTFLIATSEDEFYSQRINTINLLNGLMNNMFTMTFSINLTDVEENIEHQEDVKIVIKEEDFEKLEKTKPDIETNCAICLEQIEDTCIKLSCDHLYHIDCCKEWLCKNSNKCPQCKKEIGEGIPLLD